MTIIYKLSEDNPIDKKIIQIYHKWLKTIDEFCLTRKAKDERKGKADGIIEYMSPIVRDALVMKGYDTTNKYMWTITKCSKNIIGRSAYDTFTGLVVEEVY